MVKKITFLLLTSFLFISCDSDKRLIRREVKKGVSNYYEYPNAYVGIDKIEHKSSTTSDFLIKQVKTEINKMDQWIHDNREALNMLKEGDSNARSASTWYIRSYEKKIIMEELSNFNKKMWNYRLLKEEIQKSIDMKTIPIENYIAYTKIRNIYGKKVVKEYKVSIYNNEQVKIYDENSNYISTHLKEYDGEYDNLFLMYTNMVLTNASINNIFDETINTYNKLARDVGWDRIYK